MKRNLFLCLLAVVVFVTTATHSFKSVEGQTKLKAAPVIVTQPGDAGRLGLPNQAEARQLKEGKLRVPALGAGSVPRGNSLSKLSAVEPVLPAAVQGRVLILYDSVAGSPTQKFGLAYAIMLSNLLGHFNVRVNLMPIERYNAGNVELYQTVFYLGTHYDNAVPSSFLQDVRRTSRTVVWFKNNIWQFAWNPIYEFVNGYGFNFVGMRGFDSQPSPDNQQPGFYDTITYKTLPFVKFYSYDTAANVVYADPDLGVTQIIDPQKADEVLSATNSRTGQVAPYVVKSNRFWYVADLPFSFIGPRDRYLVFCDLLHDILGQPHTETHRAMIRLEDVSAKVEPTTFRQLTDYLFSRKIPFSIAMIPTYRDAFGANNNGVSETIQLSRAADLLNVITYARQRGGGIVMHGHTHQYNSLRNPSGVTGTDWEYWDAAQNAPVPGDNQTLMLARIDAGLSALRGQNIMPFAWETPHYQGSPMAYKAARQRFSVKYERGTYYTADRPNLTGGDYAVPQFFPYLVREDYYGHRVLPENLGNVIYSESNTGVQTLRSALAGAACGQLRSLSQSESLRVTNRNVRLARAGNHFALYENARYAWVVRDGFASFFFHPFLLQPQAGVPAMEDLQDLIDGITQLGYEWKAASSLVTGN